MKIRLDWMQADFTVQEDGNSKVDVPIISLSSATNCASASMCPFHPAGGWKRKKDRAKGERHYPLCYALAEEWRFKLAQKRDINGTIILFAGSAQRAELAEAIVAALVPGLLKRKLKYARINESGDFSASNIDFAVNLAKLFNAAGVTVYGYSKAPEAMVSAMREAGAVILRSEVQFVCVNTAEEAQALGLTMCPGQGCGKACLRCPTGQSSAILAHR